MEGRAEQICRAFQRQARLTNGHSKKSENPAHGFALFAVLHHFVQLHRTLSVIPEMAVGVYGVLWSMEKIVKMIDADLDASKTAISN